MAESLLTFNYPHGGIHVIPRATILVPKGARYFSTFSLEHGRVGTLDIDYVADAAADGVVEMTTRAYGYSPFRSRAAAWGARRH